MTLLAWDTEFWGFPVAMGDGEPSVGGVDMGLIHASDLPTGGGKWRTADVRVTLDHDLSDIMARDVVRTWQPSDIEPIAAIAREAFRGKTRFYNDSGFPDDRCDDLYETWARDHIADTSWDVLVAEREHDVAGFVTIRVDGEQANIGLAAVASEHQGHGSGTDLVNAAVAWARMRGAKRLTVVTSGCNVSALRLYEGCGFRTSAVELWFHRWER